MSRPESDAFKSALYLIGGGSFLLGLGLKRLFQMRKIEDTPCSEIRSASQGLVEIEAYALPHRESFQSYDGGLVAYREFRIEEKRSSGKNSKWVELYREVEGMQFIASDGTGIVLVDGTNGELLLNEDKKNFQSLSDDVKQKLRDRYGTKVPELIANRGFFSWNVGRGPIRICESSIRVGGPVYVRGSYRSDAKVSYIIPPHHLSFLEKIRNLRKDKAARFKSFDLNADGNIDEEELSKGARKIFYQSKNLVTPDEKPEPVAVQGMFHHDEVHGLLVADSHQKQLAKRLGGPKNALNIILGALLIAMGVAILAGLGERIRY